MLPITWTDRSFLRVLPRTKNNRDTYIRTRVSGFPDHVRSPPGYMKQRVINFRVTTRRKRVSAPEHERRRRRRGAGKAAVTFFNEASRRWTLSVDSYEQITFSRSRRPSLWLNYGLVCRWPAPIELAGRYTARGLRGETYMRTAFKIVRWRFIVQWITSHSSQP